MIQNIDLFLNSMKASKYAEKTVLSYEIHLRHFYSFCIKYKLDYKKITNKEMLNYKNLLAELYSSSSINCKLSAIKSFYDFLIEIDEVDHNVVFSNLFVRYKKKKTRHLNIKEKELLFDYLEHKKEDIQLAFKLLFDTGLRISELIHLNKEDLVNINDSYFLQVNNSKCNKSRLVPIFNKDLLVELLEHIEIVKGEKIFDYSIRNFQNYASDFSIKSDVSFSIHSTRSTFATEKLNDGMRIDVLQKILGHEDITTTMLYASTNNDEILKLGASLN